MDDFYVAQKRRATDFEAQNCGKVGRGVCLSVCFSVSVVRSHDKKVKTNKQTNTVRETDRQTDILTKKLTKTSWKPTEPDKPFPIFKASISVDRQVLCSSGTVDGF